MSDFKIHKVFTQSGASLAVVIPIEYAKDLGIEDGTYVRIAKKGEFLLIEKMDGSVPAIVREVQVKEA